MKLMLIAALMFMGCATVKPVERTSEAEKARYVTNIIGEDIVEQIEKMLEYNPHLTDRQLELLIGKERMAMLKADAQIKIWIAEP